MGMVVHLNVSEFKVENIRRALSAELDTLLDSPPLRDIDLEEKMLRIVEQTGRKFVFIIDEWDAVIRAAGSNTEPQIKYLAMLHLWFKNGTFTPKIVAAAFMTA